MRYLWGLWLKPEWSLSPLDKIVMGLEVMVLIVLLGAAWAGWTELSERRRKTNFQP